jgi:tetratricopeptide (TPR) repeat protein
MMESEKLDSANMGAGKRWLGLALVVVFFMVLCLIVPLFYFFQTDELNIFAARWLGLSLGTPPPSRVLHTATQRPVATFSEVEALASQIAMPTSAAFTFGNPTATPLGSDITDVNFQNGLAAYKAKQYEAAIELMTAAIQANPDLAPPYRYRAIAYYYLRRCNEGLPDIEKALSIDPNYASAWAGRGSLELCLGDNLKAIPDLQKALSLDASLSVAHLNLGVAYFRLGDYEKALEEYTLSAQVDPGRAAAWGSRGEVLSQMGRYTECVESTTKAIEINAEEWFAYVNRGDCEVALQQYAEAVKDYELAKPSMGSDAHFYCQISYAYFGAKQYQDTLDAADKSIIINPACGGPKLLIVAARSAIALDDNDRALEYVDKALLWPGTYPLAYYYRGVILQNMDNKAEAVKSLKQFLKSNPTGPEADDAQARLTELAP